MDESKKIILELTLDELKLIDKYVELNDETESVFDKIKDAYPQLKMTLQQEGDYVVVSYNDTTYYRLMNETTFAWYIKKGVSVTHPVPTLVMVTDAETERLLDGLYYNHIVVKKEKEPKDNEWKNVALEFGKKLPVILPYSYAELSPNSWYRWVVFTYDKYMEERDKECGYTPNQKEQKWDAVRESVKWCEENSDKDPLDWVKPQTPEQVADGLKEAFREAVKQGVVSSIKSKTLTDLIYRWWSDVFTTHSDWDMETSIEDLVDQIEMWLPKEHDTNSYKWNQCIRMIKEKLR